MATVIAETSETTVLAPLPSQNQVEGVGRVSRESLARHIWEAHKRQIQARYQLQLIWEKLLLHADGSGDAQWADIFHGSTVEIPRLVAEFHHSENLLRPIMENAIAHHTGQPLRFFAESGADRAARNKALMDTIWINDLTYRQDLNGHASEGLYLAMPCGFCPIHAYWRDDAPQDWYEAVVPGDAEGSPLEASMPLPGMIDIWTGNPFGTVFNSGATRNDVRWGSYERTVNANAFRRTFAHVPGVEKLEGTYRLPSASIYQKIARTWIGGGSAGSLGIHGRPVIEETHYKANEEVITLVCREAVDDMRLQIIAVPGYVDSRYERGGTPFLVVDQPLPANDFSWSLIHSHWRGDDIHGKPWLEDPDELQVRYNIARSRYWEQILKMADAPIVAPGGALSEDMMDLGGYNVAEIEPGAANWRPRVMEWPQSVVIELREYARDIRDQLFRLGGYQAVSRGETPGSRFPYRAILLLQQADLTVHGPVNQRFQRSMIDFASKCWRQAKQYMTVPWLVSIVGDEYAHLAEQWVDNTKLSDTPPRFVLNNPFGNGVLRGEEVKALVALQGADGMPFLTTEEARRAYPDRTLFGERGDTKGAQMRRARVIAEAAVTLAMQYRNETGLAEDDMSHPWVQQAAQDVFYKLERRFLRLRDDDLNMHLIAISEITQDEQADPIARLALMYRQDRLYAQQQAIAEQRMAQMQPALTSGPRTVLPAGQPTGADVSLREGALALEAPALS